LWLQEAAPSKSFILMLTENSRIDIGSTDRPTDRQTGRQTGRQEEKSAPRTLSEHELDKGLD
jgi:hypothetical protein